MTDIRGIKPLNDRYNGQTATQTQALCPHCRKPAHTVHSCIQPIRFLGVRGVR
jgi:hypothetical protein